MTFPGNTIILIINFEENNTTWRAYCGHVPVSGYGYTKEDDLINLLDNLIILLEEEKESDYATP